MKILVVDGDYDILSRYRDRFKVEGFGVDCCTDGRQAIYMGHKNEYQAVVLETSLAVFSGHYVLKNWRSNDRFFHVAVVSGAGIRSEGLRELMDLGISIYLSKVDLDLDILVEWLRSVAGAPPPVPVPL